MAWGSLADLRELVVIILEGLLGIVPPLHVVAKGNKVEVKGNVCLERVLTDSEEPVGLGPGLHHLQQPVQAQEDGFKKMHLSLEHFFGEPLEGTVLLLKSHLGLDGE
jgi:hypothetical protein